MPRAVLVVDDNRTVRLSLSVALDADPEFSVAGVAPDGQTALFIAEETRPDVVVLDLAMPRTDGLTALPQLRALCPDARIVVYTSSRTAAEVVYQLGADALIDKAHPVDALLETLRAG